MKKKVFSILLMVVLVMGCITPTFAATNGSVTTKDSRVWGQSRYGTTYAALKKFYTLNGSKPLENIVVASGANFPDALSGGYFASTKNAPIVLVSKKT